MLQQKQGARVRISSHEKVINMSEEYFPSDSKCSCFQCDSIACFKIRNINSEMPCTCTFCNPDHCLTWEMNNYESKSNNQMENIKVAPEILKDLLSVSETKLNTHINDTDKYTEHPINTTNATRKEKISFSYLDNDLQKDNSEYELKEVYSIEKNHAGRCSTMEKLKDDENFDEPEIKDSSSNEKSDIIEYDIVNSEKSHSNGTDTKQISDKCGSDIKKCCRKKQISEINNCYDHEKNLNLTNNINNKHLSSKIAMNLSRNKTAQPETKELFKGKINKCCSRKNLTNNSKTEFPEVYQIFTNEKKNIVKCCILNKKLEKKYTDISGNKQNKKNCKETKDLQNNKLDTTAPNLEIKTKSKITNIKCNHEHPIKDKTSNIDSGNYTKYTYEDISHTKNKMNTNKNIKSYEKYVSRLQSVAISYGRENYENSRAELSAQIMNVPYEEFKESLSRKQSSTDSNTYNSSIKLDKMDIFTRLKEIYKACSCKVCECIAGKSIFNRTEVCNCEPCDCNDCNGYMAKLRKRITYTPHSGCPCVSCDRKDCRGVVKSTSSYAACDCKPCDCVRCAESFTKPCSCTPCQCETCKTSIIAPQTLLVANAAASFRQSHCECEPCECANCTSTCSPMTSNLIREVSTGTITYGNCNCEKCSNNTCQLGRSDCSCNSQHKVIRKPMLEKRSNYGIHRVYIKQNKYKTNTVSNNNRNAITMFALSNNYPNRLFNNSNKKQNCECDECECIVCKDKGKGSITNQSLIIEIDNQNCNFDTKFLSSCKCSPCAYQSCKSLNLDNLDGKLIVNDGYETYSTNSKNLGCNLKKDNNIENYSPECRPAYSELDTKCNFRNYLEGKNVVNLHPQYVTDTDEGYSQDNEKCFLLKKGKLLTPSMFENHDVDSVSSHIHIKPEKEALKESDLEKKGIEEQNTKLFNFHYNNLDTDHNQNITYKIQTPELSIKVISTNSSLMNMVSKEANTNAIFKTNSVDFTNGNVSKIFCKHSEDNVQNGDSNTILLNAGLTHTTPKSSCHSINKKLEYIKDINQSSKTSLADWQGIEDLLKSRSSSINDIHFSTVESMSLVKLLCRERNLNIDNKMSKNVLQSLEKIPLKILKMDDENLSGCRDKALNNDTFFDSCTKDKYNNILDSNVPIETTQDKLEMYNFQNQNFNLTNMNIDKCDDIHDKNEIKSPATKPTKKIKSKAVSNSQMLERKPCNYNYNVKSKGSTVQSKVCKPRSKAKVPNGNLRSKTDHLKSNVNKINNKRYLEIPDNGRYLEKSDNNERCLETPNNNKRCLETPNNNKRYLETPNNNKRCLETPDNNKRCLETPDNNKRCLETPDINKRFLETPDNNKRYLETPNNNKRYLETPNNNKRCLKTPDNNKRCLETPNIIDTATSSINFNAYDKSIDLEQSFKLLRELDFNIGKNKKPSPILRKNFFIGPQISKTKGMRSIPLLKLDVKNTVKSVSLQTSTISFYCPEIGFGNKALTKLQTEVTELLYSPLLQSSFTNSYTEKSRSKNILNLELKSNMSNATSQTKRSNIVVDKEMNCNMFQSRENLKQSIQNLINMTLSNVVQRTDMEERKLNLLRDFNKQAANRSCDGLRASFVGLRKVSDHSVLLRWAMPRDLSDIQGYELQVDGRPVQKILNPSRCMAVLTCLPHCEKLLLAIRTITNLETSYIPVTTVVYYPKKNKSAI